jgi:cytochrome c5
MRSLLLLVVPAAWLLIAWDNGNSVAGQLSADSQRDAAVIQRAGEPNVSAAPKPAPLPPAAPDYDLRVGAAVFTNTCLACHGNGAYGAPGFGDAAAWRPRLTQDLNTLIEHAVNGHGRMPPKGGFFALTDAEVASAVAYVVDQSNRIILALEKQGKAKPCDPVANPDNCTHEELREALTLHMLWLLGGKSGGEE